MLKNEIRAVKWLASELDLGLNEGGRSRFHEFQSDWEWRIKNVTVAIEVEHSQRHPSTNVAKYWPRLESDSKLQLVLVHYYTHSGKSRNGCRRELARAIGKHMTQCHKLSGRFIYVECEESKEMENCRKSIKRAIRKLLTLKRL